jgi:virginiamycin B lyase
MTGTGGAGGGCGQSVCPPAEVCSGGVCIVEFASAGFGFGRYGITAGPNGNIWFTAESGLVGHIAPSGTAPVSFQPWPGELPFPHDIVTGSDGNLWFNETYAQAIGQITPAGVVRDIPIGAPPGGVALG